MSCHNNKRPSMSHVVRYLSALVFACATLFGAPAAFAVDSGDIVVVSSKGEVRITMNGAMRNVRAGSALELPASVHTGRDGSVELRQGATTVSVGPETLLEFPALEQRGAPIDRIVQPSGNAFYNVGKREGRKLRVETPYLVGVIKGTQFNVAAQGDATTISLFEGLLEVRASDGSDVVDLKAGEIASFKRGDRSINIMRMDAGKAPPTASRPSASGGSKDDATIATAPRSTPSGDGGETLLVERVPTSVRPDVSVTTDVRTSDSSTEVSTTANVAVGDALDTGTNLAVNAASTGVGVAADTSVSLGDTGLAGNAAVNVGPSGADVATNVSVDAGPVAADLGVTAVVDAAAGTVDVSTAVGVDAGPVTADLGTSTGVDLGAGTIDTSVNTSIDAGPLTTDVATDVAVDLSAGTVDTSVDVGASAPLVDVNVGTDIAVDAAAGTVNLGLDVAGTDVDVGVDLPDAVDTVETVTGAVTDTVVDVGGLLDGLIRRPGRK